MTMSNKRRFLKGFVKASLLITSALLFTACDVTFTNPLPASFNVERDERLSGKWMTRDEEGKAGYVEFVNLGDREFAINFEANDPNVILKASCARIDDSSYLIIKPTDPKELRGYLLARYSIAGDRLKVWLLRQEKFKQAVREGKLKGQVGPESYAGVTITDTPEKILEFIRTNRDRVFETLAEFERVTDK